MQSWDPQFVQAWNEAESMIFENETAIVVDINAYPRISTTIFYLIWIFFIFPPSYVVSKLSLN